MAMQAPEGRGKKPAGLYRTLWHYAAGDQRRVVLFMALLIVAQALKLAIPYLSRPAGEAVQAKGNESLGAAALASYALMALMLVRFDRVMIRLTHAQNQAQARYAATLVDCLGNIATVLTLRLAGPTRRLVAARLGAVFAPLRSSIVLNEAKWCAVDLLNNRLRCGLVVLYVWLAWRQGDTLLLRSAGL